MKYKFNPKWEFSAYYDKFRYPWLRSSLDRAGAQGDEYLARLFYKPRRGTSIYFQHKNETKQRNLIDNETRLDIAVPTTKQTQILNIDTKASGRVSLKSRIQWSYFEQEGGERELGYMLFQDINFNFGKYRLSARYAIFDTEGSNNRQYTYEKDVLYAYSIYSFSGIGVRKYLVFRYTPIRRLDFWVSYVPLKTATRIPGIK